MQRLKTMRELWVGHYAPSIAPNLMPAYPMPPDPDLFAERKALVQAAIAVYMDEETLLTTGAICDQAGAERIAFVSHFDEPDDALEAFYTLIFDQYHLLRTATEGYEQFSFEEKLATFLFILIDALEEERTFVQETFDTRIRSSAGFRSAIGRELERLLVSESVPELNQFVTTQWPIKTSFTEAVMRIIRFWLHDDSEGREATTALIDKLVGFTADLVTFRGIERGADLAWYASKVDVLGLRRWPIIGRFFSS